ncbi:MAG: hypothetical protein ACXACF_01625 [Candidatus Hermodarchaeia archaeon]|jgi:hypothetical protein
MNPKCELNNFLDHYGIEETCEAIVENLEERLINADAESDDDKFKRILWSVKRLKQDLQQMWYDWRRK